MFKKTILLFILLVFVQQYPAINANAADMSGYYYSANVLATSNPTTVKANTKAMLTSLIGVKVNPVFNVLLGGTFSIRIDDNDSDNDGFFDDWEGNKFGNLNQRPDSDYDSDGMPNAWEVTYGLNPLVNDASADSDGDGYTNLQEYTNGTMPNDKNSYPGKAVYTLTHDANGNLTNEVKN
jgi:hypothetical protein